MDTKIEIKEEDPLSDITSQREREVFQNALMKTDSDAILVDDACDIAVEREIKSKSSFPYFSLQEKKEFFTMNLVKQIECETATCSDNSEIDSKSEIQEQTLISDFDSQHQREFSLEDPEMNIKKYSSCNEMDNEIEIKEECWWLETETSVVLDDIKDGDSLAVKSSRLYTEAVSGDSIGTSSLHSTEDLRKHTSSGPINVSGHLKCRICGKSFPALPAFNKHTLIHTGDAPHRCHICEKRFTGLSNLKMHGVVHTGIKPYKCVICGKSFTTLSYLKKHALFHTGEKPHRCEICEKSFVQLSHLKAHKLIHTGEKPHRCEICKKSFNKLSYLKIHELIHIGERTHKCEICDKSFVHLSQLKGHKLIHTGTKSHKCEICEKSFSRFSHLKVHKLIHTGEKPQKCEICEKSFVQLSQLKAHILIHTGEKLHKCEICEKSFSRLQYLKIHKLIHTRERTQV